MTVAASGAGPTADAPGRIGPNAVIRVAEVLTETRGAATTAALFTAAGLARYLDAMPSAMIDEREVSALHAVLRRDLGIAQARQIGREAGVRTADYLLAHRIPKPVQALLKRLPAPLASRVLLGAIGRHAWTFAGSGSFRVEAGRPLKLVIAGGPICGDASASEPLCDFYAGTFERLYRMLVHRETRVTETACGAMGAPACVFEVRWSIARPGAR